VEIGAKTLADENGEQKRAAKLAELENETARLKGNTPNFRGPHK